jgi:Tfp pilus assembly protein PilX
MCQWSLNSPKPIKNSSGFALIVTLLLMLVLMLMAAGIAYIGSSYVDLSNSVSYKSQSINAAETCIDQATDWLKTNEGINWVTGVGAARDLADPITGPLYQHNLLTDTAPTGVADNRNTELKNMAGRGAFKSCIIQKVAATSITGVGKEIGTCDSCSNLSYTVKITADGNFNVQYNSDGTINSKYWSSNSSRSLLEVVLDYIP